ncbi:MAG: activase [Planctomycetia bacterium]|nr:activase [Planctomycetia bacterium]
MLRTWFGRRPSAPSTPRPAKDRSKLRVGIPRVLNVWSTHRFWTAFLEALGVRPENIVYSSDTSEDQGREFGKGRGAVDCCYPVKCMSGHYGELVFGQRRKLDVILSPIIYTLPSFLHGHVQGSFSCTRVAAGPENIKSGFLKEADVFSGNGIRYASPFVSFAERALMPRQMVKGLGDVLDLDLEEATKAVDAGFDALDEFNARMRSKSREILESCAREDRPCLLVLARPYHMDPGIGHEIEVNVQASGFPILWMQYFPLDSDLLEWVFHDDLKSGVIRNCFDISDVWPSSYSANTNEILWGAKVAARLPWITCVLRLSSYECGMDQPTYTPVQKIVEGGDTLLFKFGDLDSTKPSGSVRIRVETIVHYVRKSSSDIIARKRARLPADCPLLPRR